MNNIETKISEDDEFRAKFGRRSPSTLAAEILRSLQDGCPFGTTFVHSIPIEARLSVEAELKHQFEMWANSWIAPKCREIIAKTKERDL